MNSNFKDLLRVWALPLVGIPVMVLLGFWSEVASYFLFTHHLFWIIGVILLISPVTQILSPGHTQKGKARPLPLQPVSGFRQRPEAHQHRIEQKPAPATETPAERLARLQRQKKAVDQTIEQLSARNRKGK